MKFECPDGLPPLPIVPYALSLSMTVAYRELRYSTLITYVNRAKASLEACCQLLEGFSDRWWAAAAMVKLGRKALLSMKESNRSRKHRKNRPDRVWEGNPEQQRKVTDQSLSHETSNRSGVSLLLEAGQSIAGQPTLAGQTDSEVTVVMEPVSHPLQATPGSVDSLTDLSPYEEEPQAGTVEDIDALFGGYLDLAFPTSFLDPIFMDEVDFT